MQEVSAYIAAAPKKTLPKEVAEKTKHHVLDTLAAMVSGSRLLPGKKAISYIKTLGGAKEATVIGSRFVTTAINAAIANGMGVPSVRARTVGERLTGGGRGNGRETGFSGSGAGATGAGAQNGTNPMNSARKQINVKIDHNLSAKHRLAVGWSYEHDDNTDNVFEDPRISRFGGIEEDEDEFVEETEEEE